MSDKAKNQLLPNATIAILEVVATGLYMFFFYKYLVQSLGIELVGLWSIVLATTSVVKFSELGLAGSVIRYVSKYLAISKPEKAGAMLQTGIISIAILLAIFCLICNQIMKAVLPYFISGDMLEIGLELLPYALLSLFMTGVAGCVQAGVVGAHRTDLASLTRLAMLLANFSIIYLFVPTQGIFAVAFAQLAQATGLSVVLWLINRNILKSLPLIPIVWSTLAFKEMWRYGVQNQGIMVVSIVTDMAAKLILGRFGDLSAVGFYEIATKMLFRINQLFATVSQVLIPYISKLETLEENGNVNDIIVSSVKVFVSLAIIAFGLVSAYADLISWVWIGRVESNFTNFTHVLLFAFFLKSVAFPHYHANIATSKLHLNIISLALGLVTLLILSPVLGHFYQAKGVVIGIALSMSAASGFIIFVGNKSCAFKYLSLINRTNLLLLPLVIAAHFSLERTDFFRLSNLLQLSQVAIFGISISAAAFFVIYRSKELRLFVRLVKS